MRKLMSSCGALFLCWALLLASNLRAVTREELRRRYPTVESFAHHFGAMDVGYAAEHRLVLTAPVPPKPGEWSGMVKHPEDYQDVDIGDFSLDYVVYNEGVTFAGLDEARRPDICVWDMPTAKISRGHNHYRVGTVRPDLTVEIFPELTEAFPGHYYYIPALDGVYEAPLDLPRTPYNRVAFRRRMNHGTSTRFALTTGGTVTLRLGVVRHRDDDRRFLVANHGGSGVVLGEMFPFADPNTDGRERHYYRHTLPLSRQPAFALFNEVAGFECHDEPVETDTTIIYGVKIYQRYLARFRAPEGPILKPIVFSPRHDEGEVIDDGRAIGPVPSGSDMPRGSLAGQREPGEEGNEPRSAPLPHGFNPGETPDSYRSPGIAPPPVSQPPVSQSPVFQPPVAPPPVSQPPVAPPVVAPPAAQSAAPPPIIQSVPPVPQAPHDQAPVEVSPIGPPVAVPNAPAGPPGGAPAAPPPVEIPNPPAPPPIQHAPGADGSGQGKGKPAFQIPNGPGPNGPGNSLVPNKPPGPGFK